MTFINIENIESKMIFASQYGHPECGAKSYTGEVTKRITFIFNTQDGNKSICSGDIYNLPVCRKCSIFQSA